MVSLVDSACAGDQNPLNLSSDSWLVALKLSNNLFILETDLDLTQSKIPRMAETIQGNVFVTQILKLDYSYSILT